jgi:lipoate-protein ligase A
VPSPRDAAAGPSCFDAPGAHEILAAERKVIGSAQLRRKRAFLQHGSILLRSDTERIRSALGAPVRGEGFGDLERLLRRPVPAHEVDEAIVAAWEETFGAVLEPGTLTPDEQRRATRLRCWKYDSEAWTLAGRLGARELHWGRL